MTSINKTNFQSDNLVINQKGNISLTKFIHARDIHLGSHQYRNEDRANDFINAFDEILKTAVLHEVDFILLGAMFLHLLKYYPEC